LQLASTDPAPFDLLISHIRRYFRLHFGEKSLPFLSGKLLSKKIVAMQSNFAALTALDAQEGLDDLEKANPRLDEMEIYANLRWLRSLRRSPGRSQPPRSFQNGKKARSPASSGRCRKTLHALVTCYEIMILSENLRRFIALF
jgi:hypothetical protein